MKNKITIKDKFTIIIPSFNTCDLTIKCIKSIYDNTPSELKFDILVIENGSVDNSRIELEQLALNYNNLEIVQLPKNIGIYPAWNLGIKCTSLEESDVVIMGSDVYCFENWIEPMLSLAETDNKIGIIANKQVKGMKVGDQDNVSVVIFGGINEKDPEDKTPHKFGIDDGTFDTIDEQPWVTHSCVWIKSEVFKDIGGYDENFVIWSGDHDFCLRAKEKGWKIYYCGLSTVLHYGSKSVERLYDKDPSMKKYLTIDGEYLNKKWGNKLCQS